MSLSSVRSRQLPLPLLRQRVEEFELSLKSVLSKVPNATEFTLETICSLRNDLEKTYSEFKFESVTLVEQLKVSASLDESRKLSELINYYASEYEKHLKLINNVHRELAGYPKYKVSSELSVSSVSVRSSEIRNELVTLRERNRLADEQEQLELEQSIAEAARQKLLIDSSVRDKRLENTHRQIERIHKQQKLRDELEKRSNSSRSLISVSSKPQICNESNVQNYLQKN